MTYVKLLHRRLEVTFRNAWKLLQKGGDYFIDLHYRKGTMQITSTPLSMRKHLNPRTPAVTSGFRSACGTALVRIPPKQT